MNPGCVMKRARRCQCRFESCSRYMAKNNKPLTPSQKLRFTLEEIWEKGSKQISKEDFYIEEMKRINLHYRNKYLK